MLATSESSMAHMLVAVRTELSCFWHSYQFKDNNNFYAQSLSIMLLNGVGNNEADIPKDPCIRH